MFETILPTIYNIVAGAFTGAGVALGGYFKNSGENIDWDKVAQTAILGMAVGGVGGVLGMSYDNAATYLGTAGATTLIQYIGKGIVRRFAPKVKSWLQSHNFTKTATAVKPAGT